MIRFVTRLPWLLGLTVLFWTASGLADSFSTLSDGPPQFQKLALGPTSYVPVKAKQLAKARVLWLNFAALREMGIDIPRDGLNPNFEKEILEAIGYAIPNATDPKELFLNTEKAFFADRYGGSGLGVNFGSGRAASAGKIQIKGIGITPLVGEGQAFDHAHGRASLEEAIREAIWGEINQELPYGANRVLAIVDPGTHTIWKDGGKERDALIIREDPLRPAHYMRANYGQGALRASDAARTEEATTFLVNSLPVPKAVKDKSLSGRLRAGLLEYVDRLSDQYAAAFAHRLYHGATSPSNFEITGRFIDYGTMTAQPGYGKIRILDHVAPAGDSSELSNVLVEEFYNGITRDAPKTVKAALPEKKELLEHFEKMYHEHLKERFLALTGTPGEIIQKLKGTPESDELGTLIIKLATEGAMKANVDKEMPAKLSKYRMQDILTHIDTETPDDLAALEHSIERDIPEEAPRKELAAAYQRYLKKVLIEGKKDGIPPESMMTYIAESAQLRNSDMPALYRTTLKEYDLKLIDEYGSSGDRTKIWDAIDNTVAENRRIYKTPDPYKLILRETRSALSRNGHRYLYDARSSQFKTILEHNIESGTIEFFGHKIATSEAENATLRYSFDNWETFDVAKPMKLGDHIEIALISPKASNSVEFALNSADGQKWWKAGEKNISLSLRHSPEIPKVAKLNPALLGDEVQPKTAELKTPEHVPPKPGILGCIKRFISKMVAKP